MPVSFGWGAYTLPLGMAVVVAMGIEEAAQICRLVVACQFCLVP